MKWKLTDIYKDLDSFNKDFDKAKKLLKELASYKGKLNENLEEFYIKSEEFDLIVEDLYVYVHLQYHLDMSDQESESLMKSVDNFYAKSTQELSWVSPEMLSIGKKRIFEEVEKSSKLTEYKHSFDSLFRQSEHIFDAEKEEMLSKFNLFNSFPSDIYDSFRYSDSKAKKITLSNGEKIEVMDQNYTSLLSKTKEQKDRKKIFETLYKNFESNKNLLSNIYLSVANYNVAEYKVRKYKSVLDSYLYGSKIPEKVYTNLLDTCKENVEYVKRYLDLKRKAIGLEKYHSYDRFEKIAKLDKKYSYEDAKKMLLESIKELPNDYQLKVREVIGEGYVDVMPSKNKQGGAYSWGTYRSHPYILLNFNETLADVTTLAHEAGHSVHRLYSEEFQPYATSGHTIFVAEVASTFLEKVFIDYLIKNTDDRNEKIYLLQELIDRIISTFFRQSMFADFEYTVNNNMDKDIPMTEKDLSDLGLKLYKQYYGMDIEDEKYKRLWWAYIPHLFEKPFYVYQYATCHTISSKLYEDYLKDKDNFKNFVNLLKSGNDDYSFEQVLKCGVDLSKKETYMAVIEDLKRLVSELENLLKE